jgi:CRP/FNR family transcriptional regulator, cyclic AMP receptor protein
VVSRNSNSEEFLRKVGLFAGLGEAQLESLVKVSHTRLIPRGAIVFFQDDPADVLYIILSGSITVLLSNVDGRELIISEMHPGEYFGELGLITGKPRSATAVAHEKSELVIVPKEVFLALLDREPALARHLLDVVAERLYQSNQREGALAFLDAPGRLARILLQLEREATDPGFITISQEELASRTGLTRQTVAKNLGRWRRSGWLITGRGRIVLLNQPALKQIERQMIGAE